MKKVIAITLIMCCLFCCLPVYGCASELKPNNSPFTETDAGSEDTNESPYVTIDSYEEYAGLSGDSGETVYCGVNLIDPEDIIQVPSTILSVPFTTSRTNNKVYTRIEFPGTAPNAIYSDFSYHIISAGDSATMDIDTCVWAPEHYDLEIGIYNWTNARNYFVTKSGGKVSFEYTFTNLTAGEYSIYIRNRGSSSLTTGYLRYDIS